MHEPTARNNLGPFLGCPLTFILLLNGIIMIDDQQILQVALFSCAAPVVYFCLKEVVVPHMELRRSLSCGDIQDK